MAAKAKALLRFTLTGPDVEKTYETAGQALSVAITYADRLGKHDGTFYVRDLDNTVVGRVEHNENGDTFVYRDKFIGAAA